MVIARTLVINAILNGCSEADIDRAIEHSTIEEINKLDGSGRSALHHAAERDMSGTVAKLLAIGANPDILCLSNPDIINIHL